MVFFKGIYDVFLVLLFFLGDFLVCLVTFSWVSRVFSLLFLVICYF